MARKALTSVGVDQGEIEKTEAAYRDRDIERLKTQKETGDVRAGRELMFSQDEHGANIRFLSSNAQGEA